MMEFYVSGQSLKLFSPVIAADTLGYLSARVNFTDGDWDGYAKWLHFRRGEGEQALVYDIALDENDCIGPDKRLNLSLGHWEVFLTGTREQARITTVPLVLTVQESGLVDAPLHELPMSVAEQLDYKAKCALDLARQLRDRADSGEFSTEALKPLAYFSTPEELQAGVPEPEAGDSYGVGKAAPYDIFTWDGISRSWVNNGPVEGPAGAQGERGVSFIPFVDANGIISWSNDGGLENPPAQNIRGPKGEQGEAGLPGKSPYEAARENGYTGTELGFNMALSSMPYHNARHKPAGADPLLLENGNYASASITADKLAPGAVSRLYSARIGTDWSGSEAPYTQTLQVAGLPDSDRIIADLQPSEDWAAAEAEWEDYAKILRMVASEGSLTVYAGEKTETIVNIRLLVIHGDGLGSGGESSGSSGSTDGLTLLDRSTGTAYTLYVNEGKLTMA